MNQHAGRDHSQQEIRKLTVPQTQMPPALALHAHPVLHQQTAIHHCHRFHASSIARPAAVNRFSELNDL